MSDASRCYSTHCAATNTGGARALAAHAIFDFAYDTSDLELVRNAVPQPQTAGPILPLIREQVSELLTLLEIESVKRYTQHRAPPRYFWERARNERSRSATIAPGFLVLKQTSNRAYQPMTIFDSMILRERSRSVPVSCM